MPAIDLFANTNASPSPYRGDVSSQTGFPTDAPAAADGGFDHVLSDTLKSADDGRSSKDPHEPQTDGTSRIRETRPNSAAGSEGRKQQPRRTNESAPEPRPSDSRGERPSADRSDADVNAPADASNTASKDSPAVESEPEADSTTEPVEGAAPQQLVNAILAAMTPPPPDANDAGTKSDPSAPAVSSSAAGGISKSADSLADAPITVPSGLLPALQLPQNSTAGQETAADEGASAAQPDDSEDPVPQSSLADDFATAAPPVSTEQQDPPTDLQQNFVVRTGTQEKAPPALEPAVVVLQADRKEKSADVDEQATPAHSENRNALRTSVHTAPVLKNSAGSRTLNSAVSADDGPDVPQPAVSPLATVVEGDSRPTISHDDESADAGVQATAASQVDAPSSPAGTTAADGSAPSVSSQSSRTTSQNVPRDGLPNLQAVAEIDLSDTDEPHESLPDSARDTNSAAEPRRVDVPKTEHPARPVVHANPAHVVEQAAQGIQIAHRDGREMHVRLSPPELGTLQIEISVKDGAVSARLETQTAAAQQLLTDNLQQLKESLSQQGLTVDRLDVYVANQQAGGNSARNGDGQNPHEQAFEPGAPWENGQPKPNAPVSQRGAWSVDRSMIRGPLKQLDVVV